MKYLLIALMCLLPTFVLAGEAQDMAEDPIMEKRMIQLAEKVRCLVCQSEAVATSHSDWSNDVRAIMREKMKAGATDEEILDMLVERFGKSVLFDPPMDEETAPLWFAPFVMMLTGVGILFYQLRKRQRQIASAALSQADAQRVSELLDDSAKAAESSNPMKDPQA